MIRIDTLADLNALPDAPLSGEYVEVRIKVDDEIVHAVTPIEYARQVKWKFAFINALLDEGLITLKATLRHGLELYAGFHLSGAPVTPPDAPITQLTLFAPKYTGSKIYFMSDGEAIKIGRTDRSVDARRREHQTGNPKALTTLITIPRASEPRVLERFKRYHIRGEWYQMAPEIMDFIQAWRLVESAFDDEERA